MSLKVFVAFCRSDARLKPPWTRVALAAHEVILDALDESFSKEVRPGKEERRREFDAASTVLLAQCVTLRIEAPDLSVKSLATFFLRYR